MREKTRRSPRRIKMYLHDVVSDRVDPALDGVRIAHLSDIHVSTGMKPRRLHRAVEMVNALRPDFVVLTGDYVCFSPRPLPKLTEALKRLEVPAFATLGNHDHWSGADEVRRALAVAGVHVLTNEHRVLDVRGGQIQLVGIDDSVTRNHDPERAFRGLPEGGTRIVLAHDPAFADHLSRYRPTLVLSGHTHGGQIHMGPLTTYLSKKVGAKYLHGFFELDGTILYVSRGLGHSLPLRFRAPMEVAQHTLRSPAVVAQLPACAA